MIREWVHERVNSHGVGAKCVAFLPPPPHPLSVTFSLITMMSTVRFIPPSDEWASALFTFKLRFGEMHSLRSLRDSVFAVFKRRKKKTTNKMTLQRKESRVTVFLCFISCLWVCVCVWGGGVHFQGSLTPFGPFSYSWNCLVFHMAAQLHNTE